MTQLLVAWGRGDERAFDRLVPHVYRELRGMARRRMRAEGSGVQTLQTTARIWSVPTEGAPTPVTTLGETEVRHSLPCLLPGERILLFTVRQGVRSWGDECVVAQVLATGERKPLLQDAADARYMPTGHLGIPAPRRDVRRAL